MLIEIEEVAVRRSAGQRNRSWRPAISKMSAGVVSS